MLSFNLGFIASLSALGVYAYSVYYFTVHVETPLSKVLPKQLQAYGLRDLVFTTLAFPIGSIAVYSFWLIWFGMGRELIFPTKYDTFYPPWLNHVAHTTIVPINLLLAVITKHKYFKRGVWLTLAYMLSYVILLHVIKAETGLFVYDHLEELHATELLVYYTATTLFGFLMYKLGSFVTKLAHGSEQVAPSRKLTKGQDKKHK